MLKTFENMFAPKPAAGGGSRIRVPLPAPARPSPARPAPARAGSPTGAAAPTASPGRSHSFTKIFRWRLPDGQTKPPATVEIVGSFTHWQKVPLHRDSELDAWHVTLHQIPLNRTHHYMLLVDGKPVPDKQADGLAVPHGPQEEQYQLMTERGGRVFMLYAQTK